MATRKKADTTTAKKPAAKKPAAKKQVASGNNYSEAHGCNVVVHKKDESEPAE